MGSPVTENDPSVADVALNDSTVTAALEIALPLLSTVRPEIVVNGSAISWTATGVALPVLLPKSVAVAPRVNTLPARGAVKTA